MPIISQVWATFGYKCISLFICTHVCYVVNLKEDNESQARCPLRAGVHFVLGDIQSSASSSQSTALHEMTRGWNGGN